MSEDDKPVIQDEKYGRHTHRTEKHIDNIAEQLIAQQLEDNLQDVIDDAIDAQLYIDLSTKEPVGFDIGIAIGGPNIRLIYSRGACQLRGWWGSLNDIKDVDNEICETILDYLTEIYRQ